MTESFTNSLPLPPERLFTYLSVTTRPVVDLVPKALDAMLNYCEMTKAAIRSGNPFTPEIIRHLTAACFYGLGYYIHHHTERHKETRGEVLMHDFLKQIQSNYKEERRVDFYAEQLCISPKYLSQAIKSLTGKTAGEWIDEYVALEAKALLKHSNMTIQQISYELNFPSQSFFGKYFKRITGMSPKEYRTINTQ